MPPYLETSTCTAIERNKANTQPIVRRAWGSVGFTRVALCTGVTKDLTDVTIRTGGAPGRPMVAVSHSLLLQAALNRAVGCVMHVKAVADVAEQPGCNRSFDAIAGCERTMQFID